MPLKQRVKTWLFSLIGKDPEAVVVSFCSGDEALSRAMCEEVRRLEPSRRHFEAHVGETWRELRKRFRGYRIGLAPVLFTGDARCRSLRRAAFLLAPRKILAYNTRLERHHLRLNRSRPGCFCAAFRSIVFSCGRMAFSLEARQDRAA